MIAALLVACWLSTSVRAQASSSTPAPPASADILTLEAATERFLKRNLALEAARLEVGIAEAERVAARLRPRPGLTLSAENLQVSGPTSFNRLYEAGATITQSFELGNRGALRMEVADRTVAVAEARLTDVLRRRLFDLKRTYYEAILARTILELAWESRAAYGELVRFNAVRLEEGDIAAGELIKVRLERIKYETAVANAELAHRQVKIQLLELLSESSFERAATLDVAGRLQLGNESLDPARLREAALANRTDIKVAEAEVVRFESVFKLEGSRAKGEITSYVGYKRVGVDNTVLAGVTLPLPFGNRNQGGIARAEAEWRVAEANLRLARNRALAEVESAYRAYETAREQVKAYEAGLLDQADESREITLAAYKEGAAELVAFIEAQRTRAEVRANYYGALFDYQKALFQLELVTGVEIK
jgi:outer membrane protein, heavy metal efflux system